MDHKKELIELFKAAPALKKEVLAESIGMDAGNFRRYVSDNTTAVSEKIYDKIISAVEKHYNDLGKALKK